MAKKSGNTNAGLSWFRMYGEFATDPKVQMLSEAHQRRFVMLLCLRCSNGDVTLHDEAVAFQMRISNDEWAATKAVFEERGLIDSDGRIASWDKRQFKSDSSTARVAEYREKKKRCSNVTVTAPETETDTDTYISTTDVVDKRKRFVVARPDSVSESVWSDFSAQRKSMKAPISSTALAGIEREAGKAGISLESALAMCCERGWRGFKASWLEKDKAPASGTGETPYQRAQREKVEFLTGKAPGSNRMGASMPIGNVIDVTPITRKLGGE